MIVKLPFGDDTLPVDLRGIRVRPIVSTAPPGVRGAAELAATALDHPVAGPPLGMAAADGGPAVVVVPDATRYCALPQVLPEVLTRLQRGGIEPHQTTVLVACGTHPPVAESALHNLLGELPEGTGVAQHDARADDQLVRVGEVDGLVIRLNRVAVECRVLITVSVVKHHYFAGFGGGPKMIFPGLAGYAEIQANHSKVMENLSMDPRRHPRCEAGMLRGNPVAMEIERAAACRPPDLALCLVPGSDGRPARALAGPPNDAFHAAVRSARGWYETRTRGPYALGVASAGGAPADRTLIQAHKALDASARYLADGAELLFVADLSEGAGSADMEPFLKRPEPHEILRRLDRQWVQYGHTTLRLVEKTSRLKVHLVSRLDDGLARRLGFIPAQDPAAVVDTWRRRHPGETVAVVTGPAVYPAPA